MTKIVAAPQRGPNITRTMGRKIDFDTNDEKKRNFFLAMMFLLSKPNIGYISFGYISFIFEL